ncbi:MAG: hypothetical protein KatS3mg111_1377 [Pirellulaceae bacterium]|nr:MAG: hypothetical protein KatS3mg111_1377 [Pirellulaceae bacterium]
MIELHPWILAYGTGESQIALWQVQQIQQRAVAIFSEASLAEEYARREQLNDYHLLRPPRDQLIRLFIASLRQGIELAVLDPQRDRAQTLFRLRDVLRAAREQLSAERRGLSS